MAASARGRVLLPSLLDRLTDDRPSARKPEPDRGSMSIESLRRAVLRDMSWLLNTGWLSPQEQLADLPEVRRSVLNYGIPELSGLSAGGLDVEELERELRRAILDFEPRILPQSLDVKVVVSGDEARQGVLAFEIRGRLWAEPTPIHVSLHSDVDIETGHVVVRDTSSREA